MNSSRRSAIGDLFRPGRPAALLSAVPIKSRAAVHLGMGYHRGYIDNKLEHA